MKAKSLIIFITCIFLINYYPANSQENSEDLVWVCWKATVKPSLTGKYIELSNEIVAKCKEQNFPFSFYMWTDGESNFTWYYPANSIGDIVNINNAWEKFEFEEEKMTQFWESIDYHSYSVQTKRDDLSYSDNPRLTNDETFYAKQQVFYLQPGKEMEFEKIIKDVKSMLESNNYQDILYVSIIEVGLDLPAYMLWTYGKDPIDWWTQNNSFQSNFGNELASFNQGLTLLLRKQEINEEWWLKNLSYIKE